jgi:2-aminoethylphosphonate-pyruvate transaminase
MILMNPGPVNVSERVRQALLGADLCHREDEYYDLQDEIRALLLDVFGLSSAVWASVLITGSGTAALEMAIASSVSSGGRMLVVDNGVYGDRIARMAAAHGIAHERVVSSWTTSPDLAAVESKLTAGQFEVVAAVHHETTTGLINPIGPLADLAHSHGAALVVDSISGLAGDAFDFEADLVVGTANKCVQGLPGISFALGRRAFLAKVADYPPRTLYLHLPNQLAHQERRSTPFTPAVQVSYALREALLELREETVPGRIARYQRAAAVLRAGFDRLGLAYLLPSALRSNTITSLELPTGSSYDPLHDALKARGYVIYAGQGDLAARAFRVANMGAIPEEALRSFEGHLAEALGRVPAAAR